MIIENREYGQLTNSDFFIGTIGYEPRSLQLLKKNRKSRNADNTLLFCLDKKQYLEKYPSLSDELSKKGVIIIDYQYESGPQVAACILDLYDQLPPQSTLHIDYSSMPRGWYCRLPKELLKLDAVDKRVFFWYVPGKHIGENFPTAGINRIFNEQGNADPAEKPRYHIMGLGYDKFRSEAVYSIIEPENLVICYSFSTKHKEINSVVEEKNKRLFNNSVNVIDFPIDDFSGMVSILRGLVDSYLQYGQVIIVPDGPKPLVLAMSMIPDIIGEKSAEQGLTCLYIERSSDCEFIEVEARPNEIFGFEIRNGEC